MLDFLNEVSVKEGYESWYDVYYDDIYSKCKYSLCNHIPQKAAKRFLNQEINGIVDCISEDVSENVLKTVQAFLKPINDLN